MYKIKIWILLNRTLWTFGLVCQTPILVVQKLQTPFVVFLCPKDSVSVKKLLLTEKYCKYQP